MKSLIQIPTSNTSFLEKLKQFAEEKKLKQKNLTQTTTKKV